jgi:hypothetical protein
MGNPSRPDLHPSIVEWGRAFVRGENERLSLVSSSILFEVFESDLKQYFRLCALSRSKTAIRSYISSALKDVFGVRSILEKSIIQAIDESPCSPDEKVRGVLANSFFGFSKKQGTSLRMPLASCNPTKLCAPGCYAHDVLDAAPLAVIRGAMNGWLAGTFEAGDKKTRTSILKELEPHAKSAVRNARKELLTLPEGFQRRPFIRFSHVGEIVAYPEFADALARLVKRLSRDEVDCVVYTRHRNVSKLDPNLWVINFTLDPSSMNRQTWAPSQARVVFSAFGGITSDKAEVNFLEHHRHTHTEHAAGGGRICPATKPETKIRTCDACRCNRCFVKPTNNPDVDTRPASLVSTS